MRHGTTVWNEKGITQGRTNNRLSSQGKLLTEEVAKKHKDIKFDLIITSPLMRTVQTANIMNRYHNVKVIKDQRLIEIDQGIFSGKGKNDLTEQELELKFSRAKSCGMESYEECFERIKDFVEDIKQKYEHKTILVITHNVNASFITDVLEKVDVDFENANHLRNFKNAQVKLYNVKNENIK